MFVDLVAGKCRDEDALRQAWIATYDGLRESGDRWLGATAGMDADGGFLALITFESEEGARVAADFLEARGLWQSLEGALVGFTVTECPGVRAFALGEPGKTDTVEVTRGRANDLDRVVEHFERLGRSGPRDLLGGLLCWNPVGEVTSALYRRSRGAGPDIGRIGRETETLLDEPVHAEIIKPWTVLAWGASRIAPPVRPGRSRK